jgi:predicted DNA-binding transcriptional regulator YafY
MDKKVERIINLYTRLSEGEVLNKADEARRFGVNERSIQRGFRGY